MRIVNEIRKKLQAIKKLNKKKEKIREGVKGKNRKKTEEEEEKGHMMMSLTTKTGQNAPRCNTCIWFHESCTALLFWKRG